MKITYLGHSCFCLEDEKGVKVITDPYTEVGYELPMGLTADVVTVSHGHFDHNYVSAVKGGEVLALEGSHTVRGIRFEGVRTWHDSKEGMLRGENIIFKWEMDGIKFCHFGDLGEPYSIRTASIVKDADVWMIPIGGKYTIDATEALTYIEQCAPKAVILMHYRPEDGKLDIASADAFMQLESGYRVTSVRDGELTLADSDLQLNQTKIFYMERKR